MILPVLTKHRTRILLCLLLSLQMLSCIENPKGKTNAVLAPSIIPKPTEMSISKGQFEITTATKISNAVGLKEEAEYLSNLLDKALTNLPTDASSPKPNSILLKLDATIPQAEGYQLQISSDSIVITGKTNAGVFYGVQSLRQLLPATIENRTTSVQEITVPALTILDSPRYPYRGMHLDVGRHFFPVEKSKRTWILLRCIK